MDIEKIILHNGYDPQDKNHLNDIARIRMASVVSYSDSVLPICIPLSNQASTDHVGSNSHASTQMCVGGVNGKDTCSGDSGGPLMRMVGRVWYQIGVVSFGPTSCVNSSFSSVYTDVSKYVDCIRANVY
ncbi:hypothetical protein ZHAS_00011902 [Anopheles sinensis]|uniref:Peptidase S1 domain-containing protein n=1 Tax=Anopheles sinensis TaxID=74873 RepID=A0A084W1H6_ANOSI|nr:hypothetical protein ZHAS_00011902 [Anopheles sinensis]